VALGTSSSSKDATPRARWHHPAVHGASQSSRRTRGCIGKPTDSEKSQWYFQRFVTHLPIAGEMVLFDRSRYNRAGVERVMGFCTSEEYDEFTRQAPMLEDMLVSDGIHLTKFWFSVSPAEQRTRFAIRLVDPVRRWKLSPMDMESVDKWEEYTAAKEQIFHVTDTDFARWIVVKSNDKKRARINAMRHLLAKFDYDEKDDELVGEPDPQIVGRALED
jgi:polyphosphate kinase